MQKQAVVINFAGGIDTKTDPYQLPVGEFLALNNGVFDKAGGLVKRNGFPRLTTLPNTDFTNIRTLNDNLVATGSRLYAFSEDTNQWLNQGNTTPVRLDTLPLVRVATSQTHPDTAIAANGLACVTYIESTRGYYHIIDSRTGQQIVARTALPANTNTVRVFVLGPYFIITFATNVPSIQYIAIPTTSPTLPSSATNLATGLSSGGANYDGVVTNNTLYIGYPANGTNVIVTALSSTLTIPTPLTLTGTFNIEQVSVTADTTGAAPVVWISFYGISDMKGYSACVSTNLVEILAPVKFIDSATVIPEGITSTAAHGILTLFLNIFWTYASGASGYPVGQDHRTDYIATCTVIQATGVVSSITDVIRSVGLASKAFIGPDGSTPYILSTYGNSTSVQPSYFLIDSVGNIIMRLAYSNAKGYITGSFYFPSVTEVDGVYNIPYLIADLLASVNKETGANNGGKGNIYTQYGINLAKFTINASSQTSSEIAGVLNLTGGLLWQYDGVQVYENNFNVWPEDIAYTTATTGGFLTKQIYFYVFCYEWTDNQGNLNRSAPSIPFEVDLHSSGTDTNANALFIPTLRITQRDFPNPIHIVGYRWSHDQPVYYQFTSITSPHDNATTVDFIEISDTAADSTILGNNILYTTGGVVENIAPPACIDSALYQNRVVLIDAEDNNRVWYSKQVIETTPVEFSDLFTFYVAPTTGAQGSTGKLTCLSAMDDKLILFKKDAIYYMTGQGPNNTGGENDFSEPIFITSAVGCSNSSSIVLMPNGLMFQSDKGIWLLGRDLSTKYIGDRVEKYNDQTVVSALTIPGTNQVRFTLDSGLTLMYDYYYNKWGTFSNLYSISDTLYQGMHTYLNRFGQVFQEEENTYLDGSTPVLMNFQTGWLSMAGLRGFERFYYMFLLGTYFTPFKLNVQLAYNYSSATQHSILVTPDNNAPNYGNEANWGSGGPWSGVSSNVFQAKVDAKQQKCQTFQITVNELYDATLGVPAGQGLNFSGISLVVGGKKGWAPQKGSRTFG